MSLFAVSLRVQSEMVSAEQIVETLGVQPDVIHRKGDRVSPSTQAIRKTSAIEFWALGGDQVSCDRLSEYLLELVPPLESLVGLTLRPELTAWVSVGVSGRDMGNVICFEPSFLLLMSQAGAQLSIDTYSA